MPPVGSRTSLVCLPTILRQSGQHLIEDAPFQPNACACASTSCTTIAKPANTRDRSWADAAVGGGGIHPQGEAPPVSEGPTGGALAGIGYPRGALAGIGYPGGALTGIKSPSGALYGGLLGPVLWWEAIQVVI